METLEFENPSLSLPFNLLHCVANLAGFGENHGARFVPLTDQPDVAVSLEDGLADGSIRRETEELGMEMNRVGSD